MASALFGFEGTSLGKPLASARTLKTAQEEEMQDERRTQKKTVCAFHGHFRIQANHREMDLGERRDCAGNGTPHRAQHKTA